jgi:C-terminal processing protease CtpA/Prc
MVVAVDANTASSAESSTQLLRAAFGARLVGEPTMGCLTYGDITPYVLPRSRLVVLLPTKWWNHGEPLEFTGLPVDVPVDPATPAEELVRRFDEFFDV